MFALKLYEGRIPDILLCILEHWFSVGCTCVKWGTYFSRYFNLSYRCQRRLIIRFLRRTRLKSPATPPPANFQLSTVMSRSKAAPPVPPVPPSDDLFLSASQYDVSAAAAKIPCMHSFVRFIPGRHRLMNWLLSYTMTQ